MMLYVMPPPAAAGPPSPWSTILCDGEQPSSSSLSPSVRGGQQPQDANDGRLTYKRNASNNRRVKAWLNAVQKNNRPPPPRKPPADVAAAGLEVRFFARRLFFYVSSRLTFSLEPVSAELAVEIRSPLAPVLMTTTIVVYNTYILYLRSMISFLLQSSGYRFEMSVPSFSAHNVLSLVSIFRSYLNLYIFVWCTKRKTNVCCVHTVIECRLLHINWEYLLH